MKTVFIALSLALSLLALTISVFNRDKDQHVYIDAGKVYTEFQLTKFMSKQYEDVLTARKKIIDSLMEQGRLKANELKFNKSPKEAEILVYKKIEEEYNYKTREFEKQNQETQTAMNTKIWNQLNQYIGEFGKERNYSFMFGATGEGNLMYADGQLDVTDEVINYINTKYNAK